ncbi:Transposase [Nostoc sphaeroides CCNUC1]|uniref:Transposase n=1 Tax=Nostoc sphaeroides CCNUC1 TaxID=2653204 RepID=A0A5P8WD92_9NOSO|nr:Transposase [Nostoc sphaeroides CCNUC1]
MVIHQKSSQIICLEHGLGRIHDFKLFKSSGVKFGELLKVIADKGYQGNGTKLRYSPCSNWFPASRLGTSAT